MACTALNQAHCQVALAPVGMRATKLGVVGGG